MFLSYIYPEISQLQVISEIVCSVGSLVFFRSFSTLENVVTSNCMQQQLVQEDVAKVLLVTGIYEEFGLHFSGCSAIYVLRNEQS